MATEYDDLILSDGPLGYWSMAGEDPVVEPDQAGSNDMSATGSVQRRVVGPPGMDYATRIRFGADNYMATAVSPTFALNVNSTWSMEAWVRSTSTNKAFIPIEWGGDPTNANNTLGYLHTTLQGAVGWATVNSNSQLVGLTTASGDIADGEWHHLVFVGADQNRVSVYVDGVPYLSAVTRRNRAVNRSIGVGRSTTALASEADHAGVAVYDYALTQEQVSSHFYAVYPSAMPSDIALFGNTPLEGLRLGAKEVERLYLGSQELSITPPEPPEPPAIPLDPLIVPGYSGRTEPVLLTVEGYPNFRVPFPQETRLGDTVALIIIGSEDRATPGGVDIGQGFTRHFTFGEADDFHATIYTKTYLGGNRYLDFPSNQVISGNDTANWYLSTMAFRLSEEPTIAASTMASEGSGDWSATFPPPGLPSPDTHLSALLGIVGVGHGGAVEDLTGTDVEDLIPFNGEVAGWLAPDGVQVVPLTGKVTGLSPRLDFESSLSTSDGGGVAAIALSAPKPPTPSTLGVISCSDIYTILGMNEDPWSIPIPGGTPVGSRLTVLAAGHRAGSLDPLAPVGFDVELIEGNNHDVIEIYGKDYDGIETEVSFGAHGWGLQCEMNVMLVISNLPGAPQRRVVSGGTVADGKLKLHNAGGQPAYNHYLLDLGVAVWSPFSRGDIPEHIGFFDFTVLGTLPTLAGQVSFFAGERKGADETYISYDVHPTTVGQMAFLEQYSPR